MTVDFILRFSGILLGVLARTLLPWLRKLKDGKVRGFGRKYLVSALASLVAGLILTLVIFPKFEAGSEAGSFDALFKLFCLAFGFGFGWNGLVLEGEAWVGSLRAAAAKAEQAE